MDSFISALLKEIHLSAGYLGEERISTIYFGGGTPSLLSPGMLLRITDAITHQYAGNIRSVDGSSPAEWTIELNPEDVTEDFVLALTKTPFNRFSLGIQSFSDSDLQYLNRSHTAAQAVHAVKTLHDHGFSEISIDLIFGIPPSGENQWEQNIETAFSLAVPHISAYALTVEQRTPLEWMIRNKKSLPVNDALQATQFKQLMKKAGESGYTHYEISNFALPGHFSIHNTNYWNGTPYLGLGPSAHSYDRISRRWNISNLSEYIVRINQEALWYESETLTPIQRYNEYVMTSLRTMWGCRKDVLISDFGFRISDLFRVGAEQFISRGWLIESNDAYFLTEEGKLFADGIASSLFIVD